MGSKKLSRREVIKMSGAAAVAALLAACQPKVVEKIVEKEVTKIVEVEVTKAPAEKVVINWATPAGLGLERTMYTNFSYKFMEENPGIKVKMSFESWGDYMTKLPTMMAAGMTPDVCHSVWSIAQGYAYRGVFIDHMPYMERDGVDPDEFVPEVLAMYAHGGKQFLLPKDSAIAGFYYNKTLFDEYGVEYPKMDWDLDDFVITCKLMTRDENGYPSGDAKFDASKIKLWGFKWYSWKPNGLTTAVLKGQGGIEWYAEDNSKSNFGKEAAINLWEVMRDLQCIDHAIPSPGEALGQGHQWRAGLTAMCCGHHSETFDAKQENVRFKFDVVPPPGGPFGQYVSAAGSGFGVTTNAPHKEEGWKLLNFLTSEETQYFIGQQKRWGVQRKKIMGVINPNDGIPEHFAQVHTEPWMPDYAGPLTKIAMVAPVPTSRIDEIYGTELDSIFTCTGGNVAEAARSVKKQVDEVLAEVQWPD